jgi:DNA invertase Pin-like site-specific DNA recombinase
VTGPVQRVVQAVGYLRVSTDEQAASGLGLDAQRAAVERYAAAQGWELVEVLADEGTSGKTLEGRVALDQALNRVEGRGRIAQALIVAKLDRLSRSLLDFAALMERSRRNGWQLVALDLGVDTATPSGEMMANVLATFAQFERRLIGQRTRDALAAKKAAGARLGRPVTLPQEIRQRIVAERLEGRSWPRIAANLNNDGVPTARGGACWRVSTVQAVYRSAHLDPAAVVVA